MTLVTSLGGKAGKVVCAVRQLDTKQIRIRAEKALKGKTMKLNFI
jgi:hypothetical protein